MDDHNGTIDEAHDGGYFMSMCSGFVIAMLIGCWFCYCIKPAKKIYVDDYLPSDDHAHNE